MVLLGIWSQGLAHYSSPSANCTSGLSPNYITSIITSGLI